MAIESTITTIKQVPTLLNTNVKYVIINLKRNTKILISKSVSLVVIETNFCNYKAFPKGQEKASYYNS